MTQSQPERKRGKTRRILSAVSTAIFAIVFLFLLAVVIFDLWVGANCYVINVDGHSMEDTLQDGDRLYARVEGEAERGAIVVIDVSSYRTRYPAFTGDLIIKRIVAVEGDSVKCEGGVVYLKAAGAAEYVALDEPYAKGVTPDFREVYVGSGEIFFLGDNREHSYDSQEIGPLKKEDVYGVVEGWALRMKWYSTAWEGFRASLFGE